MPPPLLIDVESIDLTNVVLTKQQIYEEYLPHRHEFMLLDGVCYLDKELNRLAAYRDVEKDAWWFRGHVPGRPLLPGVLMLEMAAHASALLAKLCRSYPGFIGFGGIDHCKFRETVSPPARLYFLVVGKEMRSRRIVSETQGVTDGKLVFEARVTGLTMPYESGKALLGENPG